MRLLSGLWLLALVLFNPLAVEAHYVGGEPDRYFRESTDQGIAHILP